MAIRICFLRAVNIGRTNRVKMDEFVRFFQCIEMEATPYIQSGNFILQGDAAAMDEDTLQERMNADLHINTVVFLRTVTEYHHIMASYPYTTLPAFTPQRAMVSLLRHPLQADAHERMSEMLAQSEYVSLGERVVYSYIAGGTERTLGMLEKVGGVAATMRNWNTMQKMHRLCQQFT